MKSKGQDCDEVTCTNIDTHKTIIKRKLSSKYAINDEKIDIYFVLDILTQIYLIYFYFQFFLS